MTPAEAMVYAAAFVGCATGRPALFAYSKVCELRGEKVAGWDVDDGAEALAAFGSAASAMLAEFRAFGQEGAKSG